MQPCTLQTYSRIVLQATANCELGFLSKADCHYVAKDHPELVRELQFGAPACACYLTLSLLKVLGHAGLSTQGVRRPAVRTTGFVAWPPVRGLSPFSSELSDNPVAGWCAIAHGWR